VKGEEEGLGDEDKEQQRNRVPAGVEMPRHDDDDDDDDRLLI